MRGRLSSFWSLCSVISVLSLEEGEGGTQRSGCSQEGREGLGPSPAGGGCVGDFQEALSPWLGPLAWAGLLLEGLFPPPWGRAPGLHKAGNCSQRGAWAENTSGHCVSALKGVGRGVSHRWPAVEGWVGAVAIHPSLDPSLASVSGRDGRQRPQMAVCSLYDFLSVNSHCVPSTWTTFSFPVPTHSPSCPHIRLWRELGYHFPFLLLQNLQEPLAK